MPELKKRCFIITPIGGDADSIRRHIDGIIDAAIRPALEQEYDIVVAHKIMDPGSITKQVITEIYKDELVVANLTNRNPNVMYELALRHCLGKPVIMIAEKGTSLPSDIIMERTIFYQNDALGTIELRENLKQVIASIDFEQMGSPIHDVIHDINATEKILEISRTADGGAVESGETLEFILEKLDGIESKLHSIRVGTTSSKFPRKNLFLFTYNVIDDQDDQERIGFELDKVSEVEPKLEFIDYKVIPSKKEIQIVTILYDRIDVPGVYRYFIKTLEKCGFEGIETKLRNAI